MKDINKFIKKYKGRKLVTSLYKSAQYSTYDSISSLVYSILFHLFFDFRHILGIAVAVKHAVIQVIAQLPFAPIDMAYVQVIFKKGNHQQWKDLELEILGMENIIKGKISVICLEGLVK